jgi:glycosyltransferase involved in cell wall biosynthesis
MDSNALKNAIERLLDDKEYAASLGQNARRYIENHFNLAIQIKSIEELYSAFVK